MKSVSLKDLILSPEESKDIAELLAQKRGIKDNENMSNDKLLGALKVSENKNKTRIEKIKEEIKKLQHKFSRQKLKEILKSLYEIENRKNLSASKKTLKCLNKLGKIIYKLNIYYDYDDVEYRGIKDINDLFGFSISEDYFKPIIVNNAFNNNDIQYESKRDKDKILTITEYLNMIRPYLVDMINDHKSQSEWKIQLAMAINFISSKPDSDETRIMYIKSINTEIMIGSDTNEVIEELFKSLSDRYQVVQSLFFDAGNVLHYDLNKISLNRGGSYTYI